MKTFLFLTAITAAILLQSCEPAEMRAQKLIKEGQHLSYMTRYEQALEKFEKAARIQPELPAAWFNIGNVKFTMREFGEAFEYFTKAIELDSTYGEAYANRGKAIFAITADRMQACPDWIMAHELGVPSLWDDIKNCPGIIVY